jgi:hypothetical protein
VLGYEAQRKHQGADFRHVPTRLHIPSVPCPGWVATALMCVVIAAVVIANAEEEEKIPRLPDSV